MLEDVDELFVVDEGGLPTHAQVYRDRGTGEEPAQILERLRALLELPVEIVLPTHGFPADRAALERALT